MNKTIPRTMTVEREAQLRSVRGLTGSSPYENLITELDAEREVSTQLLDAVKDALAFLDRPDITTYEWYKLAPEHVGKFRRAIAKAEAK